MNTFVQSDKAVYLFQDGVEVAQVKLGDRYKAEVCTETRLNFSVKLNSQNSALIKKTINVKSGNQYYFKISCPLSPEVAVISDRGKSKGKKDLAKTSKFNGVQNSLMLNINANSSSTNPVATSQSSSSLSLIHISEPTRRYAIS